VTAAGFILGSDLAGVGSAVLAGCAIAGAVLAVRRSDAVVVGRISQQSDPPSGTWSPGVVAERIGRIRLVGRLARADVARDRLAAAHAGPGVDRYVGCKALGAAALAAASLFGPAPAPLLIPVLAAGALLIPDLVLARIAKRRRARIEAQLPQFLDLLAAGSTAGLSALQALRRASASVPDPLTGELAALLERVDLGARWREELRSMAERLRLGDLRRAVMAMTRTESLGTPLAESLRRRADEVREGRRAAAAERARKAPVKMLFPLVFMILPAFLLLTVVPVLLSTLRSVR
jgi:Flp pilus assembly protein TadB